MRIGILPPQNLTLPGVKHNQPTMPPQAFKNLNRPAQGSIMEETE
jgi:hypothetical protein